MGGHVVIPWAYGNWWATIWHPPPLNPWSLFSFCGQYKARLGMAGPSVRLGRRLKIKIWKGQLWGRAVGDIFTTPCHKKVHFRGGQSEPTVTAWRLRCQRAPGGIPLLPRPGILALTSFIWSSNSLCSPSPNPSTFRGQTKATGATLVKAPELGQCLNTTTNSSGRSHLGLSRRPAANILASPFPPQAKDCIHLHGLCRPSRCLWVSRDQSW